MNYDTDSAAYAAWIVRALSFPPSADPIFRANPSGIRRLARRFAKDFGIPRTKVYRGILVTDEYVARGLLKPAPEATFLSFSEDRAVAEEFADLHSDMSFMIRLHAGSNPPKGYMIEYRPDEREVLFYWRWLERLGMLERFSPDIRETIVKQKEIMIDNNGLWHELKPFAREAPCRDSK